MKSTHSNLITDVPFGNQDEVLKAKAGNIAFKRAREMGYSHNAAVGLARTAKREASVWEDPHDTAVRVVQPQRATFTGQA